MGVGCGGGGGQSTRITEDEDVPVSRCGQEQGFNCYAICSRHFDFATIVAGFVPPPASHLASQHTGVSDLSNADGAELNFRKCNVILDVNWRLNLRPELSTKLSSGPTHVSAQ